MNIFLNKCFGFCFELNFELNHLHARFKEIFLKKVGSKNIVKPWSKKKPRGCCRVQPTIAHIKYTFTKISFVIARLRKIAQMLFRQDRFL